MTKEMRSVASLSTSANCAKWLDAFLGELSERAGGVCRCHDGWEEAGDVDGAGGEAEEDDASFGCRARVAAGAGSESKRKSLDGDPAVVGCPRRGFSTWIVVACLRELLGASRAARSVESTYFQIASETSHHGWCRCFE